MYGENADVSVSVNEENEKEVYTWGDGKFGKLGNSSEEVRQTSVVAARFLPCLVCLFCLLSYCFLVLLSPPLDHFLGFNLVLHT